MRFSRAISIGAVVALCAGGGAFAAPAPTSWADFVARLAVERPVAAACCKVCRTGKACGNSCISRSKSCSKGAGCACDG